MHSLSAGSISPYGLWGYSDAWTRSQPQRLAPNHALGEGILTCFAQYEEHVTVGAALFPAKLVSDTEQDST